MTKQFSFSKKQAYLEQFYQSGLTQTAFCRQQGLVFKTFNKWLKNSKTPPVDSEHAMNHFQNPIAATNQEAFIPIHLNDTPFCEPSPRQPPEPDCPCVSSKNALYQSVFCFKTNRFSLDIPLDLSTEYGQAAAKAVMIMLHQLPIG